jgi:hypothetical protein
MASYSSPADVIFSGYRGVFIARPMDCPNPQPVGSGGDTPMSMDTCTPPTPSNKRSRELDGEEIMHEASMHLPAAHRSQGWASY